MDAMSEVVHIGSLCVCVCVRRGVLFLSLYSLFTRKSGTKSFDSKQ